MEMQISCGNSLGVDVVHHHLHLFRRDAHHLGHVINWDAVVLGIQAQVHLVVGQGEIELVLTLGQRIGVCCGGALSHLFGYPQVLGQLIDLGFVEMGYGFDVGGAVAQLDEEALVVLQAVGGAGHGIVEPVCVVVLQHLVRALLEVGAATISR